MTKRQYELLTAYYTARWRASLAAKGFRRKWHKARQDAMTELLKAGVK